MSDKNERADLPPYDVYATILAYGPNRPKVLADVLELLRLGCQGQGERGRAQGSKSPGFNVSHAWVRSVGEIGVVMLRFETTEEGYRNLRRIDTGALPQGPFASQPPLVRLHRAWRPWHLDDRVRSVVLRYEGTIAQWTEGSPGAEIGGEQILDELLHNLAGDEQLDVAQVDIVRTRDAKAIVVSEPPNSWVPPPARPPLENPVVVAALRLFDLGRRGRYFLDQAVDLAKRAIHAPQPPGWKGRDTAQGPDLQWPPVPTPEEAECREGDRSAVSLVHPWFALVCDSEETNTVDQATQEYISHALRGPVESAEVHWESASVFVHALDVPGLLAEVTYSVRRMGCRIDRVSCRGLGRDAVVLMTVGWQTGASITTSKGTGELLTPLVVEHHLRDNLKRFYERKGSSIRAAEYERGGSEPAGYWNVYVERNVRPAISGVQATTRLFVESPVFAVDDRESLLDGIVKSLERLNTMLEGQGITPQINGAKDPAKGVSIYYLDLRPQVPRGQTQSVIGLGVMIEASDASKALLAQQSFTQWWKNEHASLKDSRTDLPP